MTHKDMAQAGPLMAGKRGLVMGVANDRSIAWGIARMLAGHGAQLAFTYQGDAFGRRAVPLAENSWDGWRAWIDGQPAPIKLSAQLAVDLAPGQHTVAFRYMPWDVPLGLGLCL